jgi:GNAT superfamily N-acetyltransferase
VTKPETRLAIAKDATPAAELIADAFSTLDATAWLVPDPQERARVLPAHFEIYVDHALTHGEIHLIEDDAGELVAAAVWFPQITGPGPQPDNYGDQLLAACGPHIDRFRTLDRLFDDNHPSIYPHHHLAYLATRPDQQRRGLGSALLRLHHSRLDHFGAPAFLQASSERARKLYERHGYESVGEPFHLPNGATFWSMWREPVGSEVGDADTSASSNT